MTLRGERRRNLLVALSLVPFAEMFAASID